MSLQGLATNKSSVAVKFNQGEIDFSKESPFIQAVAQGNIATVETLLKNEKSEEERKKLIAKISENGGKSPLEIAAAKNDMAMFSLLKNQGGRVDVVLFSRVAASCSYPNMLNTIFLEMDEIEKKKITADPQYGIYLLIWTCNSHGCENLRAVWNLIDKSVRPAVLKQRDKTGHPFLVRAINLCTPAMLREVVNFFKETLMDPSVDPKTLVGKEIQDYRLSDGTDLLMLAAAKGSVEKLEILLDCLPKENGFIPSSLLRWNDSKNDIIDMALNSANPQMLERVLQLFSTDALNKHLNEKPIRTFDKNKLDQQKAVWKKEAEKRGMSWNCSDVGAAPVSAKSSSPASSTLPISSSSPVSASLPRRSSPPAQTALPEGFQATVSITFPSGQASSDRLGMPAASTFTFNGPSNASPLSRVPNTFPVVAATTKGPVLPARAPITTSPLSANQMSEEYKKQLDALQVTVNEQQRQIAALTARLNEMEKRIGEPHLGTELPSRTINEENASRKRKLADEETPLPALSTNRPLLHSFNATVGEATQSVNEDPSLSQSRSIKENSDMEVNEPKKDKSRKKSNKRERPAG